MTSTEPPGTEPDPEKPAATGAMGVHRITLPEFNRIIRRSMPAAVAGIALLAVLYTLYFAADLFLPIFFAILLGIILRPLVRSLRHLGLPEAGGAFVIIGCLVASLSVAVVTLSDPVEEWVDRLPRIQQEITTKLWPVTRSIEQAKQATEKIEKLTDGRAASAPQRVVTIRESSLLNRMFKTTWFTAVQILTTLVLTYFFLAQNIERTRQVIQRLPWYQRSRLIEDMFETVQKTMSRYLQISAMIYFGLGAVTAAAMYLLGMPNPILLGLLAAVFGFIPYLGPLIVLGCISVISLLSFDNWWAAAAPPLVYLVFTIIEGYLVTPAVVGRHLMLSPIAVFLSMLLWTWVWGIAGALLSVPILVLLTIVVRHLVLMARDAERGETGEKETG